MRKIASPQDLQAELRRLLAYSQSDQPSREMLASELRGLADRVAGNLKKLPSVGATKRWAVMDGDTQIGTVEKNRSTKRSLEPYHAEVGSGKDAKAVGSFYDETEVEGSSLVGDDMKKKLKSEGRLGDGLALATKAVEKAA